MLILPVSLAILILLIPCVLLVWVVPRLKSRLGLVVACWVVAPVTALALVPNLYPLVMTFSDFHRRNTVAIDLLKVLSQAVLICLPTLLAAGIGSTIRNRITGLALAWFLTPVMMGIVEYLMGPLVSFCFRNPNVHPMEQMPIALIGLFTGLISAIGAVVIGARQHPLLNLDKTRSQPETQRA